MHDLTGTVVAIIDDAINAGSATRATFAALTALGAQPVAVGALLILGDTALPFFAASSAVLSSTSLVIYRKTVYETDVAAKRFTSVRNRTLGFRRGTDSSPRSEIQA